jgi:hypothetical protein
MLARTPWRLMTAPRNLYGLAREMGRPVARGEIPLAHADAALWVDTLQQERDGALGPLYACDVARFKRWLLRQEVERQQVARDLAAHRVRRAVAPMLAAHRRSNAVLAEAHGVNGAAGFPLTEEEVTDVVRREMFFALPAAPRGFRHAG